MVLTCSVDAAKGYVMPLQGESRPSRRTMDASVDSVDAGRVVLVSCCRTLTVSRGCPRTMPRAPPRAPEDNVERCLPSISILYQGRIKGATRIRMFNCWMPVQLKVSWSDPDRPAQKSRDPALHTLPPSPSSALLSSTAGMWSAMDQSL